jgi:hypothetical protein
MFDNMKFSTTGKISYIFIKGWKWDGLSMGH